jgi:CzcA family heavy metal efflux pump
MSLADFAERHRHVIAFGVACLTIAGIYSALVLPSGIYPEVEFPRITIVAHSGDLSPRIMQLSVTRALEEAARGALGVRRVRSKTIRGASELSVVFEPDADMRHALQLLQGKVDEVRSELPAGTTVIVERMTPAIFPIMSVNVTGRVPAADLRDVAQFQLRPALTRIPGVSRVEVVASEEREVSVIADPTRLAAARLSLPELAEALRATNDVTSVGRLPKDYRQYLVLSTAELTTLDDVRRVVVAFRNSAPVTLGDVADVREGVIDRTTLITGNGEPAALITVARQIRGNILEIAGDVRSALAAEASRLPSGIRLGIVYDLAAFVREAVRGVRDAILIGGLLAVGVLLLFLRDGRATAIAAASLPITMAGSFFVVHLLGGTVNLMSLGGLAIAIGLVIDDAIVVVENIHRHLASGQPASLAARAGTSELVAAVVGSTLTTVVVFVPLGLLEGVVGQFFAALSMTLSAAVLLSLVVALLFVPSVAARLLGSHARRPAALGRLTRAYERLLRGALAHPWPVIAATVGVAALGVIGYGQLDTGFLPEVDEGGYVIDYWTPPGTSLPETDRMVRQIEAIVRRTPEVAGFARRTGTELGVFATEQNRGDILVRLKSRAQRSRDAEEIISEQREHLARELPGVTIEFMQLLQDMLGDLEGNPEPIEVKFFGDDLDTLTALADTAAARMARIPGIVDIVKPQTGNPELELHVDPVRAAKAGFTVDQVSSQLAAGLLGERASWFRRGDRLVDIRVRFPDRFRFDEAWIREFPLAASSGLVVPLSAVADVRVAEGVSELHREDLRQMVPVSARLERRDLGSAAADLRRELGAIPLPVGSSYVIGGQYETQQQSFRSLVTVLALAVLLVFGVLVAQFRRFSSAAVILSAAPLSIVGAFAALLLTGTPLNVSSFMGLILLIGLIVKNGIILVDYADLAAASGDVDEALVTAGTIRLRPILMTTLCTLFGLLPLGLGLGPGAEMQKPLAIAVIGGLTLSTAITLVFVPTLISVIRKRQATGRS